MARCDNLTMGRDLTKRVGEALNLQFIKDVQINTSVESSTAELTVTILLTEEQEKKIIGEG